jgi:ADP-ribose pyrophosphatase
MTLPTDEHSADDRYPSAPRVAVGALVFKEGRVLLVRRGKAPARSQWAIPGGSVNLGESLQQAAQREIFEETGIRIAAGRPVYVFDVVDVAGDGRVRYHYVIIDLEAVYQGGTLRCGDDALDARWVAPADLQDLEVNPATRRLLQERYGFGAAREET